MQDLINQYIDLNQRLSALPYDIDAANVDLHLLKMKRDIAAKDVDAAERAMLAAAGGIDALGSNEAKRKAALADLRATNTPYRQAARALDECTVDVDAQQILVDRLDKQFQAAGYQSRLLAGLLNYMGSAGVPVTFPAQEEVQQLAEYGI